MQSNRSARGYIDVSLLKVEGKQIGFKQLNVGGTLLQALVAGSSHHEVIECSQFIYPFQPLYGPGVDSASCRYEYQKLFLGSAVGA
jgi:hypothetical protein